MERQEEYRFVVAAEDQAAAGRGAQLSPGAPAGRRGWTGIDLNPVEGSGGGRCRAERDLTLSVGG